MAADFTSKPIRRLQIGANVVAQIALLAFLVLMINYLGFEHYRRWDLSRDKKYALSDKSKRFLESIGGKLHIFLLFSPSRNPIADDTEKLLTEYQYAAKGKIDVQLVDPVRSASRAKELIDRYKMVANEEMVILDYSGRSKVVKASDMAEVDEGNAMFGESPKVTAFKGEQAITSAMIDLVEGKKNVVGYLLGHKEPPIADAPPVSPLVPQEQRQQAGTPLSVLKASIENENITFQALNLFEVPAIPAEVRTIFINGPQYDLSDRELKLLHDFWDKQGRLLILIDPAARTPKLNAFLNEQGVRLNDDRLMALMKTGIQEVARVRDVIGRFLPDTPITKRLADVRAPFPGGTCSLTLDQARVQTANIRLQPMIEAERGYWAETDYNSTDAAKMQADAQKNASVPIVIGASVEKGGTGDERVQANSSRMIVVTNSGFVLDNAITQDQQALDFISASLDWLMNREQLIGIAPKIAKTLTFSLSDEAMRNLRWIVLLLLPLVPAVLAVAVWWQRRT